MATRRAMPILQVRDPRSSVAFYARLGFDCHGFWGEPPSFCVVQRGDVTIGLYRPERAGMTPNEQWAAYIYVDDVDAVHAELTAEGIAGLGAPCDQPYGCRDFDLRDPDGNGIAFGQDLDPEAYGPGMGPERGKG